MKIENAQAEFDAIISRLTREADDTERQISVIQTRINKISLPSQLKVM